MVKSPGEGPEKRVEPAGDEANWEREDPRWTHHPAGWKAGSMPCPKMVGEVRVVKEVAGFESQTRLKF